MHKHSLDHNGLVQYKKYKKLKLQCICKSSSLTEEKRKSDLLLNAMYVKYALAVWNQRLVDCCSGKINTETKIPRQTELCFQLQLMTTTGQHCYMAASFPPDKATNF